MRYIHLVNRISGSGVLDGREDDTAKTSGQWRGCILFIQMMMILFDNDIEGSSPETVVSVDVCTSGYEESRG